MAQTRVPFPDQEVDPACYGGGVSGTGDVDGPASATDNALARYDGASGKVIQNSGVTLDDDEEMIGLASLTMGERAASAPVAPGQGQFWVSDNGGDPTAPRFTSDDTVDHALMLGSNNLNEITIAADARANLGLVIGTNVQAWDADLDAIAALGSTGFAVRTAANTWAQRSITVSAELTISNGDGVLGNPRISIAANGVTNAMLRDSAALSVIGRSVNSTGDPADIAAGSDHQVLRRSGTSIGFGQLNLAQSAAVTGTLPIANGGTGATAATGTGNVVLQTSPTLTTPNIGVATGTSLAATGLIKSSGTAGIGYATGAGGTVTQLTNKATGVTLNKICGQITTNNANLAGGAEVSFTVTNSTVAAGDCVIVNHGSGGTFGPYLVQANNVTNGTFNITLSNLNATVGVAEAIVINFAVIKAVSA